jgi:DNA helicase-2/ATP-dependent DNA helicase PcrA
MDIKLEPFDEIKKCITDNNNFVLQGGAGSGKTEILKQTLEYLSLTYPSKKIACITHTNLAVDEIKSRVGEGYIISTIHSFLNDCIKNYKKNLHDVIYELFRIDFMEREAIENYTDEKEQKTEEHKKYKKVYGKYTSRLYSVQKGKTPKVEGKREYDQAPEDYNTLLNNKINDLNVEILTQIESKESSKIKYNDTRFNSYRDLTYGHDGLLEISALLFEKYPTIRRILQDKFDCIFVDEYQDTNEKVIDIFLNKFPDRKTLIGLFGDSMQAIYSDGIGDVENYINGGLLKRINKEDNYRCSEQVVMFINNLRNDNLTQNVAFKKKEDETFENIEERQGSVEFYYSYSIEKPQPKSTPEENKEYRDNYMESLDNLISKSLNGDKNYRQLKLTNKSIAFDAGFEALYSAFNERFTDNKEAMDNYLAALQLTDLFELCNAYKPHVNSGLSSDYNLVLSKLKKQGVGIKKITDKKEIKEKFDAVINSELSLFDTLDKAFDLNLLKKSEQYLGYLERRDTFLEEISTDVEFKTFRTLYLEGKNTLPRIRDKLPDLDEYEFDELKRKVQKEAFYNDLFSDKIKFQELLNYFNYQNEYAHFITMHKTKGSGIDNVLVVLDEYFWNEYKFRHIYSGEADDDKKWRNQKLFYVACSRAKDNLKIVRLISGEKERSELEGFFGNITEITKLT